MRTRQVISAWIFAILWAFSLAFIWLIDVQLKFSHFIMVSLFWAVFAWLTHASLAKRTDK
jgi:hypothetical protein